MKMHEILFKNWKMLFENTNQTGFKKRHLFLEELKMDKIGLLSRATDH